MSSQIELTILSAYLTSESYNRAVTAHLKPEYFETEEAKLVIQHGIKYAVDTHTLPTKTSLLTELESESNIPEAIYQRTVNLVNELYTESLVNDVKNMSLDWLVSTTETWCKEQSAYNVVMAAVEILDGKYKENGRLVDKSAIPDMMQKALSISFDTTIGHDYTEDAEARFEFMHQKVSKIPFKSPLLNRITNGGTEKKTCNMFLAPTGAGKSLAMCSLAADYIELGYNVLYITLEMAEQKISERIDANLLNVPLDQLKNIPKATFLKKIEGFKEKGYGKLIVKEYPTASAGCSHFRFLLQELEIKQGFIPDVVFLDYIGIATSARYKNSDNMYQTNKSISEEFRGLAVERNFVGWSAAQTNRGGVGASDLDMTDISESFGITMVCDLILALISTDELVALNQIRLKQLKNRYGDPTSFNSFLLSIDRAKMRIYEQVNTNFPQNNTPTRPIPTSEPEEDFGLTARTKRAFGSVDDMIF